MEGNTPPIPRVLSQPLSVDFIEKEMPQIHEAFKGSHIQYNSTLKRFVAVPQAAILPSGHSQDTALTGSHSQPMSPNQPPSMAPKPETQRIPARERIPGLEVMTFWNKILGKAMREFKAANLNVPKKLVEKPEYNIRGLKSWHDIHDKLLRAMKVFNGDSSQASSAFKKAYRYVTDKNDVARQAVDFVPDMEYTSPVKAAVKLILGAAEHASKVRKTVGSGFDEKDLEKTFGNIEVFLATFPGDENIEKASIDLIACTLKAVEGAIVYYLSHTLTRVLGSVSPDFQKDLVDSIGEISVKCETLRKEALNSHIESNRKGMELIIEGVERIEEFESAMGSRLEIMSEQGRTVAQQNEQIMMEVAELRNLVLQLFLYGELKGRQDAESERHQEHAGQDRLTVERNLISGIPTQSTQGQFQTQQPTNYHHQHSHLLQQPSIPPQGMVPMPGPFEGQVPVYYHSFQPQQQPAIHVNALLEFLRVSRLDEQDLASILDSEESILLEYRGQAKNIMLTEAFSTWATSPTSCELLVQGDSGRDVVEAGSALSLVSATLIQALRSQNRFIPLVFFCQQHIEPNDPFSGPKILFRSLITQLLQQHFANYTFWEQDFNLANLRSLDVDILHLKNIFEKLVRKLPQNKTLVCVLDGVEAYETAEYDADLRVVINSLLGLVSEPGLLPTLKVLATSHTGTVSLEECFDRSELSILEVEGLSNDGDEDAMRDIEDSLEL